MIARLRIAFVACWCVLALAGMAVAQDQTDGPDYTEWRSVAVAAEQGLDQANITDEELQTLRDLLNDWRDTFIGAEGTNAARVRTVQSQLDALGPEPAEGDPPEPTEIDQRRADLESRLTELQAPQRRASEALSEANGLIAEIDAEFRARQAQDLMTRGPTPLNPTNWLDVLRDMETAFAAISSEIAQAWASEDHRQDAWSLLPVMAALLVVTVLVVGMFRRALERWSTRLQRRSDQPGAFALGFLISLLQVIVPVASLLLLVGVITATGLLGPIGVTLISNLVAVISAALVGRWMALKFFAEGERGSILLSLTPRQKAEGRTYVLVLWTLAPIFAGVDQFAETPKTDPHIIALLSFPLVLLASAITFRLGALLMAASKVETDDESSEMEDGRTRFLPGLTGWIGVALRGIALAAPLAAVIGYMNLADWLVLRSLATAVLIALLTLLHYVMQDLYALGMRKKTEDVSDALVPVLLTLLLTIASLPLFALVLGAREGDITDAWLRVRQGLTIGDLTISPSAIFILLVVFTLGFMATRFIQSTLRTVILPKTQLDLGARTAVISGVGYVGVTLAVLIAVTTAGINLSSLAIVAGALSVGIGFGLQTIVSNFVSGIILLVERPISEGDWIEVGSNMGIVKDISVRATRVETFDRQDVIIPNSDLVSGTVTNWTRYNNAGRIIIKVGVSYDSDSRQVEKILREIAESHPLVVLNPPPAVFFRTFGDNSLDFEIRAVLRDVNFMLGVQSEISHEILRRFREERINIPFPQRDIWLRRPGDTEDVKGAQMTDSFSKPELGSGDSYAPDVSDLGGADDVR